MKVRASHVALGLALLGGSVWFAPSAGSAEAGPAPTCRGKEATVVGTAGPDRYQASDFRRGDVVAMLGGDDRVYLDPLTSTRNLTFCGSAGRDKVKILDAGGRIVVSGGAGRDFLGCDCPSDEIATARLLLLGGRGEDRLPGGGFDDEIKGGRGDDLIVGLYGRDNLYGGSGNDRVFGSQDDDRVRGGDGDDRISGDYWRSEGQTSGWEPPGTDKARGGAGVDSCRAEIRHGCEESF